MCDCALTGDLLLLRQASGSHAPLAAHIDRSPAPPCQLLQLSTAAKNARLLDGHLTT